MPEEEGASRVALARAADGSDPNPHTAWKHLLRLVVFLGTEAVCACVCARGRACVRACMRADVREREGGKGGGGLRVDVRACVRASSCPCMSALSLSFPLSIQSTPLLSHSLLLSVPVSLSLSPSLPLAPEILTPTRNHTLVEATHIPR